MLGAPAFTSPMCTAAEFLRSERQRVEVITFSPMGTVGFHRKVRGRKRNFVLDQPVQTKLRLFPLLLLVCLL